MLCGASLTEGIRIASAAKKCGQAAWSILTDDGVTERPLGIHASAQEILARPYYPRHDTTWRFDRIIPGIRYRAVYLHFVLTEIFARSGPMVKQ